MYIHLKPLSPSIHSSKDIGFQIILFNRIRMSHKHFPIKGGVKKVVLLGGPPPLDGVPV